MPPKTKIAGVLTNVQEALQEPVKQVRQQFGDMPGELVKMMYGDYGQEFPTEEQLEQQRLRDEQRLDIARQKHTAMLGGINKPLERMSPQSAKKGQPPIINPFDNNKRTRDVGAEMIQKAVREQFESTQDPRVQTVSADDEANRKKELAAQEQADKKAQEQATLETRVVTPPGKETGTTLGIKGFKRRSNPRRGTPRATVRLRSAESRVGQGVGG